MPTLRVAIDAREAKMGASEFNRATASMKSSAGSATMSIEQGFSSAMRRILLFGGAGGAIYALKKFVDSASDAQETMNKFNVVFGENRREVAQWSEEFGDRVGRATNDVRKWLSGVQDLFVPLGFARSQAAELSKSIVQLAVDVGSFNNVATADVIRDFNSALVGNHETVRKYGIIISETALAHEALNQKLGKEYKDLTDLEKVQLRYSLIQKGTTDAQGDAIRSMNDYANQSRRLKAELKEISTELGGPLMDGLTNIFIEINKHSDDWKEFFKIQSEGWAEVFSGFESVREIIGIYGKEIDEAAKKQNKLSVGPGVYGGFGAGTMGVPPAPRTTSQMLPVGELNISPKGYQRIEEMNARRALIDEVLNYRGAFPGTEYETPATKGFVGPPVMDEAAKKQMIEDARDFAHKRADITARMYEDMGSFGTGYYDSQKELLDLQLQDYSQYVNDKVLLEEWYESKLNKIAVESSGFWLGVRDATQAAQSALSDYFMEFDKFDNLIDSVANSFQRMFANMASQMAMFGIMSALVGGPMAGAMGFQNPLAGMGNVQMGGLLGSIFKPSAMGNVFSNGRLVPMQSGAIINGPTYFPLSGGDVGLMGEAGKEGIFPLKRTSGGKLGIEASGQQPVIVNPAPVKVIYVRNEKEAMLEAMMSDEGQQAIIMANR